MSLPCMRVEATLLDKAALASAVTKMRALIAPRLLDAARGDGRVYDTELFNRNMVSCLARFSSQEESDKFLADMKALATDPANKFSTFKIYFHACPHDATNMPCEEALVFSL